MSDPNTEQLRNAGEAGATLPPAPLPWWQQLDTRDHAQIRHATDYAAQHHVAGVPGHSQFMLIAKLFRQLQDAEQRAAAAPSRVVVQRVAFDEQGKCWRDLMTGVRVDLSDRGRA